MLSFGAYPFESTTKLLDSSAFHGTRKAMTNRLAIVPYHFINCFLELSSTYLNSANFKSAHTQRYYPPCSKFLFAQAARPRNTPRGCSTVRFNFNNSARAQLQARMSESNNPYTKSRPRSLLRSMEYPRHLPCAWPSRRGQSNSSGWRSIRWQLQRAPRRHRQPRVRSGSMR
jgi:hypothetical protein